MCACVCDYVRMFVRARFCACVINVMCVRVSCVCVRERVMFCVRAKLCVCVIMVVRDYVCACVRNYVHA